ncbi:MAG: SIMPL domain-containing protein [bacterium]
MIEFDENLNPVDSGRPTELPMDDMPPQPPYTPPAPPAPPTPPQPPAAAPIPPPRPATPNGGGVKQLLNLLTLVVVVGVVVGLVAIFRSPMPGSGEPITGQPEGLTVSAEGTAYASPDVAKLVAGVRRSAAALPQVKTDMANAIDKIKEQLKDAGVKDADIKTTQYSIYPTYNYNRSGTTTPKITGYEGTHSLTITIRDLDKVNDVVDRVTNAGANDVGNIAFTIDDPADWEQDARAEAIKKAKDKARQIADDANISLGDIVSINEYVVSPPNPMYDGMGGGMIEKGTTASPGIEPGNLEVTVSVTLVYKIH